MAILKNLAADELIACPPAVQDYVYEVLMGSHAFGTDTEKSDRDIYGIYVPCREEMEQLKVFKKLDHAVESPDGWLSHDFKFYSLMSFIQACLQGKSQAIEMLFVSEKNILYQTEAANILRERRKLFLSKFTCAKFQQFANEQVKTVILKLDPHGKFQEFITKFGWNVKTAAHSMRLFYEVEQMLNTCDLNLTATTQIMKDIRAGTWSEDEFIVNYRQFNRQVPDRWWFGSRGCSFVYSELWDNSKLPDYVDGTQILQLVHDCLESHFGSLVAVGSVQLPDVGE